jgi:hypothetical protein
MKKLCSNCKYFIPALSNNITFVRCRRFPYIIKYYYYLANGGHYPEGETTYYFSSTARSSDLLCGPSGKFYNKTV